MTGVQFIYENGDLRLDVPPIDDETRFLIEVARRARTDPSFVDAVQQIAAGRSFVVLSGQTFIVAASVETQPPTQSHSV